MWAQELEGVECFECGWGLKVFDGCGIVKGGYGMGVWGFEGWGRVMWEGMLGIGVFVIEMGWLVRMGCGDGWI